MASEKGVTAEEEREGIQNVIEAFQYSRGGRYWHIDFAEYKNVCGLLFHGGLLGAGVARHKVLEAAEELPELKQFFKNRSKRLRVVSVGGGPASDILGFCSALVKLEIPRACALRFTVVDAAEQWEECVHWVDRLVRKGDYGDVSELFRRNDVERIQFVEARLPAACGPDYKRVMKNADVILAQRLLSTLKTADEVGDVMKDIHSSMREGALLFLINACLAKNDEGTLVYDNTYHQYEFFTGFHLQHLTRSTYELLERHERCGESHPASTHIQLAVLKKV